MGASSLSEKLRHLVGDLGWRAYIWAYYDGDEQRFRDEIAEDIGRQEETDRRMAWLRK